MNKISNHSLVNKIRTDIAMTGIKLNAQIGIKNLNLRNMHEKSLPPTAARRRMELEYQDWARLQGAGRARGRAASAHWHFAPHTVTGYCSTL